MEMQRRDWLRMAAAAPLVWGPLSLAARGDVVEEEEALTASIADVVVRRAKERCGPRADYRHLFLTATREVRRVTIDEAGTTSTLEGYEIGVCHRDIPCLVGQEGDAAAWFAVPADTPRSVLAAASRRVHERLVTAELDLDRSDESLADQVAWNWIELVGMSFPPQPKAAVIHVEHFGSMGYSFTVRARDGFPTHFPMFPLSYLVGTRERARRVAGALSRRFETSPRIAMS